MLSKQYKIKINQMSQPLLKSTIKQCNLVDHVYQVFGNMICTSRVDGHNLSDPDIIWEFITKALWTPHSASLITFFHIMCKTDWKGQMISLTMFCWLKQY